MRTVLFLIRKEFLQVVRDRVLLFQLLVPPLIQLLLITSAATFEVRSVEVHLIDRDRSPASRRLVEAFTASGRFDVTRTTPSADVADRGLVTGAVGLVLRIPEGFEKDLVRTRTAEVQLVFDGVNGATAGVAQSYATQIIRGFAEAYSAEVQAVRTDPRAGLRVRSRSWYNPEQAYTVYIAPGILVLLVTLVGTLVTAVNITREKERGTIEQLNVTPITRGQFIAGKLTPFWILGMAEFALGLVVAFLVFGVPIEGSLLLVFLGAAVYLVTALGIGLLISTVADTQQQAQFITFFILVIYLFLSGLFTPVESMPTWAQWVAEFNPIKHLITLVRAVLLKGAGLTDLVVELLALTAFAVTMLPLSIRLYSKTAA